MTAAAKSLFKHVSGSQTFIEACVEAHVADGRRRMILGEHEMRHIPDRCCPKGGCGGPDRAMLSGADHPAAIAKVETCGSISDTDESRNGLRIAGLHQEHPYLPRAVRGVDAAFNDRAAEGAVTEFANDIGGIRLLLTKPHGHLGVGDSSRPSSPEGPHNMGNPLTGRDGERALMNMPTSARHVQRFARQHGVKRVRRFRSGLRSYA